jgi:hypothetical protein
MPSCVKAIKMSRLCQHLVASPLSLSDVLALWKVTDPLTEEATFAGTVLALHCICTMLHRTVLYLYYVTSHCTVFVLCYIALYCIVFVSCYIVFGHVLFCLSLEPVSRISVVLRKTIGQNEIREPRGRSRVVRGSFSWCTRFESRRGGLSWFCSLPPDKSRDRTTVTPRRSPSRPFPVCHSAILLLGGM